jgi:hypothetical protein
MVESTAFQMSDMTESNQKPVLQYGSGMDPDSIGSVPGSVSGSGFAIRIRIQEGKNYANKHRKKLINFIFGSARCSLLRAEGLSCSLDISKLQFLIKTRYEKKISAIFFFLIFLPLKPLDPDWIRIRIRIRIQLIRNHSSAKN